MSALAKAVRSPRLARVQIAYVAFNLTEWAAGVAIMVYAFRRGGSVWSASSRWCC